MDLEPPTNEGVFVCTFNNGENRFNPAFFDALDEVLDTVESHKGPTALVLTGGDGKFFSNGFDIDWLMGEDTSADAIKVMVVPGTPQKRTPA